MRILFALIFIGLTLQAQAQQNGLRSCLEIFSETHHASEADLQISDVIQNSIHYMAQVNGREIPVILVNKETVGQLTPLLRHTIGFQVMTKAGWPNNHGSFRYGQNIIDAFIPGQRQVGETNETGLSWKTTEDSAVFLDKIADVIGEAVFAPSSEVLADVDFYQKVMKAALFRVPFSMGDQTVYTKFDNVLSECQGACFEFSHYRRRVQILQALQQRLDKLDPGSAIRKESSESISLLVLEIKKIFSDKAVAEISTQTLLTLPSVIKLQSRFPETWTSEQKNLFIQWLVSYQAAEGIQNYFSQLSLDQLDPFSILANQNAIAYLVWDPVISPEQFLKQQRRSFSYLTIPGVQ
jgi:hypothetical protein